MSAGKSFIRLRARRRGFLRRASVWDAGEYLLSVSGTSFSERYRRFYYRDIKAIVVQRGPRLGSIGALVVLALMAMIIGISTAATPYPSPPLVHVFWLAPLLWLCILMYLNLARSCRIFVYTAVSSEEIPAIFRRSAAERVLPHIVDKIREAQGSFAEAYQAAIANDSSPPQDNARHVSPPLSLQPNLVPPTQQTLYAAAIFFMVVLASAAFAFWYRTAYLTPRSLTEGKIWFCAINALGVCTGVWALVKAFNIRLWNGVRIAVFSGLGVLGLRIYALYFTLFGVRIVGGTLTETMTAVHSRQWLGTGDCILSLLIGAVGLVCLAFAWQTHQIDPVAESPAPESSIAGGPLSSL